MTIKINWLSKIDNLNDIEVPKIHKDNELRFDVKSGDKTFRLFHNLKILLIYFTFKEKPVHSKEIL